MLGKMADILDFTSAKCRKKFVKYVLIVLLFGVAFYVFFLFCFVCLFSPEKWNNSRHLIPQNVTTGIDLIDLILLIFKQTLFIGSHVVIASGITSVKREDVF